jgi:hypothetical protein
MTHLYGGKDEVICTAVNAVICLLRDSDVT